MVRGGRRESMDYLGIRGGGIVIEEFQGRKRSERGSRREGRGRRYDASACGAQRHANDGGTGKMGTQVRVHRLTWASNSTRF